MSFMNIRCLNWDHNVTENQSYMMIANKETRCVEYDTTMCGYSKIWFPIRVSYRVKRYKRVVEEVVRTEKIIN